MAAVSPKSSAVTRIIVLMLLLSVGAILESARLSALRDDQVWGHLRVGAWILENKTWPVTGIFSQAQNLVWRDFSWGYDVVVATGYRLLGLRIVESLLMGFRVTLAALTFILAGGARGNFWNSIGLSAVAQYILGTIGPVAACSSILFFGIELLFLLEGLRRANARALYALPALFLLWANLDIGFVYGIALYALFLAGLAVEKRKSLNESSGKIFVAKAWLVGACCAVASVTTPYGYHSYAAFFAEETSVANRYLPGYTSMAFHQPQDYVLLLLTMAAFLSLGLRRVRSFFLLAALSACAALAFHAQKDGWLVVVAAVALIGEGIPVANQKPAGGGYAIWRWQALAVAGLATAVVSLAFLRVPRNREQLLARVAENHPVAACDYIRKHCLPAPLFNSYRWGSFLTWYLPEYPVAVDARRGLYPEEVETSYFQVMNAEMPYQNFPPIVRAHTLLLSKLDVMGEALRATPGFRVVYEDSISIALIQELAE